MWTEKTKNGKFKHVERYTDPITGKEKKVSITTEKNTAQARKSAQRALLTKMPYWMQGLFLISLLPNSEKNG